MQIRSPSQSASASQGSPDAPVNGATCGAPVPPAPALLDPPEPLPAPPPAPLAPSGLQSHASKLAPSSAQRCTPMTDAEHRHDCVSFGVHAEEPPSSSPHPDQITTGTAMNAKAATARESPVRGGGGEEAVPPLKPSLDKVFATVDRRARIIRAYCCRPTSSASGVRHSVSRELLLLSAGVPLAWKFLATQSRVFHGSALRPKADPA